MNFYNPYLYSIPASTSGGLLSRFSFSSLLNGTTKALNFVNQAIPVVKQMSPLVKNAKTMFKVMNEFKKADISSESSPVEELSTKDYLPMNNDSSGPTFFV
jgi:hypothetical protein